MRCDPSPARCAAAYRLQRLARTAIAEGNDAKAAALFRTMTDVLTGERPALPDSAAPVDPETARRQELAQAYAKTILAGYGRAPRH